MFFDCEEMFWEETIQNPVARFTETYKYMNIIEYAYVFTHKKKHFKTVIRVPHDDLVKISTW